MTYDEFRRQLGKAAITARDFAALVGLNPNTITNYASQGEVPTHLAVIVALMADMADHQLDYRNVIERLVIPHRKVRQGSASGKFRGDKQPALF